jgi:acyl dehydratase
MLEIDTPAGMDAYVGKELGHSDWLTVTQEMIDKFADATGDHQWIHIDQDRAKTDMPGGTTIAHGFLTLSLLPALTSTVYRIRHRLRGVNYGSNRVRFTNPVPSGSDVRAHLTLQASEPVEGGRRLITDVSVEIKGVSRPALVAETITVVYS